MSKAEYICSACGSDNLVVAEEQLFMINSMEHYCYSVKAHDNEAKVKCLDCHAKMTRAEINLYNGIKHD